jgi:aminoglycoside phosphotransferase (APT) family kinase protein
VLRRAPLGKLISSTAHRVDREFLILEAFNKYNATLPEEAKERTVPVPQVYTLCMDNEVAGAPFYVMEFIKGRIFTEVKLPELERDERDAW